MIKRKKGFTLTEVLVVVVILGILAGLILPRFFGQSERAVVSEAVGMLSAVRQAEASYFLEHTAYTANVAADLDVDLSAVSFSYGVAVTAGPPTTFTATATRLPTAPANTNGCTAAPFNGCTITLTNAGVWGGTHTYHPNN